MADSKVPRILLVDDDPDITRLVQHVLQSNGWAPAVEVRTGKAALASLAGIDIVLLDHQLPDTSGLEVLGAIRAQRSPPAVILVTAHGNESLAAQALRMGADDYLAKDAALAELLPEIMERVRRNRELRKALAAAEQDLVRAERLAAISEMMVTLHHEINNPLMAAFADVDLLLADVDPGRPQARQGLENVKEALRRIRDILQRIGDLKEARSKDYLRGVRMLDLDGSGRPPPATHRGAALIHLPDEDLARIVALLLGEAGFQVRRFQSISELAAGCNSIGVSLVVIAGGATTPGSHPLSGFIPAPGREYRVVALVNGPGEPARNAGADRVIQLPFDPRTFTQEVTAPISGRMETTED